MKIHDYTSLGEKKKKLRIEKRNRDNKKLLLPQL